MYSYVLKKRPKPESRPNLDITLLGKRKSSVVWKKSKETDSNKSYVYCQLLNSTKKNFQAIDFSFLNV